MRRALALLLSCSGRLPSTTARGPRCRGRPTRAASVSRSQRRRARIDQPRTARDRAALRRRAPATKSSACSLPRTGHPKPRPPTVGDSSAINLEGILALKPDLVVAWPYLVPVQVERLRAMGIAVYLSNPRTIDAIAEDIERLGALTGHDARSGPRRCSVARASPPRAVVPRARAGARVLRDLEPAPVHHRRRAPDQARRSASAAVRTCSVAASCLRHRVSLESVFSAAPDAIVAGADRRERPAWLEAWSAGPIFRGPTGNLLRRRFEPACTARARAFCRRRRAVVRGVGNRARRRVQSHHCAACGALSRSDGVSHTWPQ